MRYGLIFIFAAIVSLAASKGADATQIYWTFSGVLVGGADDMSFQGSISYDSGLYITGAIAPPGDAYAYYSGIFDPKEVFITMNFDNNALVGRNVAISIEDAPSWDWIAFRTDLFSPGSQMVVGSVGLGFEFTRNMFEIIGNQMPSSLINNDIPSFYQESNGLIFNGERYVPYVSNSTLLLTNAPVPEPSTLLLLAIGLVGSVLLVKVKKMRNDSIRQRISQI